MFSTASPGCANGTRDIRQIRWLTFTLVLIGLVATAACGTTQHAPLSPATMNGIATVELPFYDSGFPGLRILRVDGTPARSSGPLELAPGVHELLISCDYMENVLSRRYFGRERLRFTAEGGHLYKVRSRRLGGRCTMWIEDTATGATVSQRIGG